MKKLLLIIAMVGTFSLLNTNVNAQATSDHTLTMGIPEVCLLTTPAAAISLVLTTTTAGTAITGGI